MMAKYAHITKQDLRNNSLEGNSHRTLKTIAMQKKLVLGLILTFLGLDRGKIKVRGVILVTRRFKEM